MLPFNADNLHEDDVTDSTEASDGIHQTDEAGEEIAPTLSDDAVHALDLLAGQQHTDRDEEESHTGTPDRAPNLTRHDDIAVPERCAEPTDSGLADNTHPDVPH